MLFFNKKKKSNYIRRPVITMVVLLVVSFLFIAFLFSFSRFYQDKIFPKMKIGNIDLGGLTYTQADAVIQEQMNKIIDDGILFEYQDQEFVITSTIEDQANPDLSFSLISFDYEKTNQTVRRTIGGLNEFERLVYSMIGYNLYGVVEVDKEKLRESLQLELKQYENPAQSAQLVINDQYEGSITPEKSGQAFDYSSIINKSEKNLSGLLEDPVVVALETDYPQITSRQAEVVLPLVDQILNQAPYIVKYDEYAWALDKDQLKGWLEFQLSENEVTVGINSELFSDFLDEVSREINVEVREAKFSMENGKVLEFQPSQNGLSLKIEETISEINQKIKLVGVNEIDLIVAVEVPEVTTDNVNNLGIKELIGEGRSNFRGSPRNRRHNISVGADTLNGLLIEPEAEFSLVGALGEIEAYTGYLPELVIKGNKTIPEYGGGLCQIGTTTFRAALDAGFPITERRNHSYRVSYYEPAGTDATIYDPKPDFKFINDTGNHVLFTTEIDGNELIFRFYGTSDGRKVEQTQPYIYNYVKPGPTKLVETTDLAPGVKKCTERAHTGADAEFTRTITRANGEKESETFTSHYKPWQEVCLIGVEAKSEE